MAENDYFQEIARSRIQSLICLYRLNRTHTAVYSYIANHTTFSIFIFVTFLILIPHSHHNTKIMCCYISLFLANFLNFDMQFVINVHLVIYLSIVSLLSYTSDNAEDVWIVENLCVLLLVSLRSSGRYPGVISKTILQFVRLFIGPISNALKRAKI